MFGFAVGECGMSPEYFWYEAGDFEMSALYGQKNKTFKDEWDRVRIISYYSVFWQKDPPTIEKFMPFKWDDKSNGALPKQKTKTLEERKHFAANFAKVFNQQNTK